MTKDINEARALMRAKGIATADECLKELYLHGAIDTYEIGMYLAVDEFFRDSAGAEHPMALVKDIAFRRSLSATALRERIGTAALHRRKFGGANP